MSRVVEAARGWLGTPYRHRQSVKGWGCDCLGLIRGVWRETVGPEPETPPPYSPDWAEREGGEALAEALGRWMTPVDPAAAEPGDVLLFRMNEGAPMRHAAITSRAGEGGRVIHAYWGRCVVESRLIPWWRARIGAAFRFPER
ncbi:peptidase P60 [Brevundimonas sp. 2R-24]|uniref:Peptidase P60 n=1 Tax=Peiella sedimenti TaxID=3061083 RepID=A0ABT8SJE9_9CAUL|nr:peptidase P60 [Caulobacteraceae bacterium XZ-24]